MLAEDVEEEELVELVDEERDGPDESSSLPGEPVGDGESQGVLEFEDIPPRRLAVYFGLYFEMNLYFERTCTLRRTFG